ASHNPKAYTGAKLVREGALALSGDTGIQDVRRQVESRLGEQLPAAERRGELEQVEIYEAFQSDALRFIDPEAIRSSERRLKVVLDGGNGMAGPMVGPLLEGLGLDLVETYWTPDGEFPDHEPNPLLPENRALVIESLLKKAEKPGEAILYDVRASRAVADTVTAAGGVPYVNRVGHAFFKGRMRKEGSLFGGEVSGHYYFRDFYCADSGTIPALLVLEMLATGHQSMSELVGRFHSRYFISGEINSEVSDQLAKMEELAERYSDGEQKHLDGISVDYEDWHFNVRPSNTEPLLRLCLESLVSREDMERRRDEVLAVIRS